MERRDPEPTPADATRVTDEQRDLQGQLDHRNDDPDAPGGQLTGDQMADEAGR
ncbi:MAG: hypothetical protein KDB72_08905 [Mycobacterium sp.]|nr:hypothetical protein [Mycobacterium sp.]